MRLGEEDDPPQGMLRDTVRQYLCRPQTMDYKVSPDALASGLAMVAKDTVEQCICTMN